MTTDALAPCVTRPSAAMVLCVQDKGALIFREEGFQLPTPFQCREMAEIFYDSKHIQHSKKKNKSKKQSIC